MLARLELIGFKSFAERTRFDFAPGVTAVVGPNGSGKSNIVDAVKWVLGEQSAKSLRGGEMADVIFNGSSTRKSFGMAEVSATFNNRARILQYDGDEVTITRRVYRDGQGEYLINGEITRLKDIREMLLGSGAGQGAYSIIEQGRVDALLTTSTKDRRIVFEEAAGISRFKAKKMETLRKLDHVEADLTRVKDIVVELDKQLRTLQLQAAKAQKYREYDERLKFLRVGMAIREYAKLTASLAHEQSAWENNKAEWEAAKQKAKTGEAEHRKLEWEISRCEDGLRHQSARLGDARQLLAGHESTAKAERQQAHSVEQDLLRIGKQRVELSIRIRALEVDLQNTIEEQSTIEADHQKAIVRSQNAEAMVIAITAKLAELTRAAQADRESQFEIVDRLARLQSVVDSSASLLERHRKELTRKQAEAEQFSGKHDAMKHALVDLSQTDFDVRERLEQSRMVFAQATASQAKLRQQADSLTPRLDSHKNHRSELQGRIEVLDRLEQSFDGLGAGVKALSEKYRDQVDSPIIGLVAELLSVPLEMAPLIDLALGDLSRAFVVRDQEAIQSIIRENPNLPGRVGLITLSQISSKHHDYHHEPPPLGMLAATGIVTSDVPQLVERLLSDVVIVHAAPVSPIPMRVVTRTGELIEPDGRVAFGPTESTSGLLSRKSELRELKSELLSLDDTIRQLEQEQSHYRRDADAFDVTLRERDAEIVTLSGEAGTLREQIVRQKDHLTQLADRIELLVREADILAMEVKQAEQTFHDFQEQALKAEAESKVVQARMAETDAALAASDGERSAIQSEHAEARVWLSKVTEQLTALKARHDEIDSTLKQRRGEERAAIADEKSARGRLQMNLLNALRSTADAADSYRVKDEREKTIVELVSRKDSFSQQKEALLTSLTADRQAVQELQESAHARELSVQSITGRRETLINRLRETYAFDLTLESQDAVELPVNANDEVDTLKQKIAKLGSVNLEALDELNEVTTRTTTLKSQFDDLTAARKKLIDIIEQINGDSRRLFIETLNKVRTHFQELFRKLFGGGMADIIIEDEADVLESGIEIQARPPGKELRSINLMSGGEKTMTAVALLLAIFRNRPSPFCLLDEVDAALDEANTTRFASVVREFLDLSQFIVITHKKRTMATADVLYGITMQESGVSKQVAVKFEDWPEETQSAAA